MFVPVHRIWHTSSVSVNLRNERWQCRRTRVTSHSTTGCCRERHTRCRHTTWSPAAEGTACRHGERASSPPACVPSRPLRRTCCRHPNPPTHPLCSPESLLHSKQLITHDSNFVPTNHTLFTKVMANLAYTLSPIVDTNH